MRGLGLLLVISALFLVASACSDAPPQRATLSSSSVLTPVRGTTLGGRGLPTSEHYLFEPVTGQLWKIDFMAGSNKREYAFSPDGKFLLTSGCCYGDGGLNIFDLSSGEVKRIFEGNVLSPIWSADSQKIAFVGTIRQFAGQPISEGVHGRFLVSRDSSNLTLLPELPPGGTLEGSQDGKYSAMLGVKVNDQPRPLYLLNMESLEIVLVTESHHGFAWSPEGHLLAYNNETGLYIYDPAIRQHMQLVAGPSGDPSGFSGTRNPIWSPDGTKIVFSYGTPIPVAREYGVVPEQPHYLVEVSNPGRLVCLGMVRFLTWSPDGSQIAYLSEGCLTHDWDIYLFNVASWSERRLTSTPKQLKERPIWAPSGDSLIFSTYGKLYLVTIKSGKLQTLLTSSESGPYNPETGSESTGNIRLYGNAWSKDGRYILVSLGDQDECLQPSGLSAPK